MIWFDKVVGFIRALVPTILAAALGWAMFRWHESLANPASDWAKLLEHLGVAFWVTSIVILLYEYGAKEKKVHDSLETLNKLSTSQGQEQMRICFDLLFRDALGNRPPHLRDVHQHLLEFVNDILTLQKKSLWAKDKYIEFLNYLFNEVVLNNTKNLVEMGGIGKKSFHVPLAADMADRILEVQMSAMEKDHRYDVISDLSSWQSDQLSRFRDETERRVGKGVKVRRVFNLLHLDRTLQRMAGPATDAAKIEAVRRVLQLHLKDSNEWGKHNGLPCYEVRVLGNEELQDSDKKNYLEDRTISEKHVGLFHHGDGVVQFTVTRPQLSDMALSTDPGQIEEDLAVFNVVWEYASSPLTQDRINEIIKVLESQTNR